MSEPIPIISHTPPALSLPPDTPTPSPLPSPANTTSNTLKVKRSRPRLLKRLSAQSLLTRSRNSSTVSLAEKPVEELKRKPSFSLSTPSITTATYQKEVVTSTAVDVGQQQEEKREEDMMRSSSPETPQPTCDTSQFLSPSPSPPRHLRRSLSTSSLVSSPSVSRRSSLSSLSSHHTTHSDSDDHKKAHKSMPLLSHHTFQQLVPGSVAGECDYPLASAKRNHDFHLLFRSVPELDPLIEVYKCALQKEILLQGHIYITEHHLCFNANIFGWVTNLVIAFSDITSIEKRMTAMIIPNGIQISTVHAKHIFASFMSRDMAFDQMYKIWQMHHDAGKMQTLQPRDNSDFSLKRHDDDDDDDEMHSDSDTDASDPDDEAIVNAPNCECTQHLSQVALDATYKGTVKIMHELLFQGNFFPKALKKYEGCQDLTVSKWDGQIRESFYRRQLSTDEGVQIRCFRKDELAVAKFPEYCAVESTVRAPDTPMGDAIALRIRTCITCVSPAKVRVFVTFQVDSTKSSPIQALIEKDIFESQKQFHGRLGRLLKSKSTRRRIKKMMDGDGMLQHGQESHETSLVRRVLSSAQKAGDMAIASIISVVSSVFHLLFQMDGQQLLVLCLCTALLTNVLMAYRISSISDQLERMTTPRSKDTIWPSIKANDKKYGIGQLEQSIDGIHRAMMQLQEDVRDQSDRLHRLRRL